MTDALHAAAGRVNTREPVERVIAVLAGYQRGDRLADIAAANHVSPNTVHMWRVAAGLPVRLNTGYQQLSDVEIERRLQVTRRLRSRRLAARELGISVGSLQQTLERNGGCEPWRRGGAGTSELRADFRVPEGMTTPRRFAERPDVAVCSATVAKQCERGAVPGAVKTPIRGRRTWRWLLPEDTDPALMPRPKPGAGRRKRVSRPTGGRDAGESFVPSGPLVRWLDEHEEPEALIAERAGVTPRVLFRLRSQPSVTLTLAERVLIAGGGHLDDVYPADGG